MSPTRSSDRLPNTSQYEKLTNVFARTESINQIKKYKYFTEIVLPITKKNYNNTNYGISHFLEPQLGLSSMIFNSKGIK